MNEQAVAHIALAGEMLEDARSAAGRQRLHAASALLVTDGIQARSHRRLLATFGERFAKPRRIDPIHHRHLLDAFERRSLADYDPAAEFDAEDIASAILAADAFINAAMNLIQTEAT